MIVPRRARRSEEGCGTGGAGAGYDERYYDEKKQHEPAQRAGRARGVLPRRKSSSALLRRTRRSLVAVALFRLLLSRRVLHSRPRPITNNDAAGTARAANTNNGDNHSPRSRRPPRRRRATRATPHAPRPALCRTKDNEQQQRCYCSPLASHDWPSAPPVA